MSFGPHSKIRLFENVVKQIQEEIRKGALRPGDKLPSERELAETLNFSCEHLREILRTLETMHYVEIKPGEGVYIIKNNVDDLLESITSAISMDKSMILDLLEVRGVIEAETAKRAAIFATPKDIERIGNALEASKKAIESGRSGIEEDSEFHIAIAQASHNTVFAMLMNFINDPLTLSREAMLDTSKKPLRILKDHVKVYEAIRKKIRN